MSVVGAFFFFLDTVYFDEVFLFQSPSSVSFSPAYWSVTHSLPFSSSVQAYFLGPALGNRIISMGEKWLVDAFFGSSDCSALTLVATGSGSDSSTHSGWSVTLEGRNSCSSKMFLSIE